MDEVVKLVAQKTGLSQDQAKVAVETVVGFLKQKLPTPIAAQIDGVLGGSGAADVAKGISSLFG
jgi:ribosomal protein L7/L12